MKTAIFKGGLTFASTLLGGSLAYSAVDTAHAAVLVTLVAGAMGFISFCSDLS